MNFSKLITKPKPSYLNVDAHDYEENLTLISLCAFFSPYEVRLNFFYGLFWR